MHQVSHIEIRNEMPTMLTRGDPENKNRVERRLRQAIRYTSIISFLATRVLIIPANVPFCLTSG
jgi:peptidoglycan biosynthesis protein MviN/MurJ (putative lipid II flippase)